MFWYPPRSGLVQYELCSSMEYLLNANLEHSDLLVPVFYLSDDDLNIQHFQCERLKDGCYVAQIRPERNTYRYLCMPIAMFSKIGDFLRIYNILISVNECP